MSSLTWKTDGVYKYFTGQSHENEVYEFHKINYSSEVQVTFFFTYTILLFVILTILLSGCSHAWLNPFCTCCKREDNFRYSYIFVFIIYFWEYICDILFISFIFYNHYQDGLSITDIDNQYTIFLIISLSCLSTTYLINFILCCRMIYVLNQNNKRIHHWFRSTLHSFSFFSISLLTFGPFISVPLFNSNLFGLPLFSMQISKYDISFILSKKFFNILTQLLPLFLLRIIYLFCIKTWDIIILSSFVPILLSFLLSCWYVCHGRSSRWLHDKYLSKNQLHCFFEVSEANLSSLRHLGLTKHLERKFCELFNINNNELELLKPIDCFDSVAPRFAMRFIVRSDEDTIERVEHQFSSYVQNEQLAQAVSEIYNVGLVHISKHLAEIVQNIDLLCGAKADRIVDVYDMSGAHPVSCYDGTGTMPWLPTGGGGSRRGELHNANIDVYPVKKQHTNGYLPMTSRSSTSFEHPPVQDLGYHPEMPEIAEEAHCDDEKQELFQYKRRDKVADASSLQFAGHKIGKCDIEMAKYDAIPEDNEEKMYELPCVDTPGSDEKQQQTDENQDQFDINYRPLSAQAIRLKNWENYVKKSKQHKHLKIPSFSISAMENEHVHPVGLFTISDMKPIVYESQQNAPSESNAASIDNYNNNTMSNSADEEIPHLAFAPPALTKQQQSNDLMNKIQTELKLDTTASITHQTRSVMIDPTEIEVVLSLQSKPSIPTQAAAVEKQFVSYVPQHHTGPSQKFEGEQEELSPPPPPPPPPIHPMLPPLPLPPLLPLPPPPMDPLQPPVSLDSAYGDYAHERDQSESLHDDEMAIDVDYEQVLAKPRTSRHPSRKSLGQNYENYQYRNYQNYQQPQQQQKKEAENDSDSFDTHTGEETEDSEQTETESESPSTCTTSTRTTSQESSDTVIVHKQSNGPNYEYNKVITIGVNN